MSNSRLITVPPLLFLPAILGTVAVLQAPADAAPRGKAMVLSLSPSQVRASSSTNDITGGAAPEIAIHPAHGVNISFLSVGEEITDAWLDDNSKIALAFNGAVCAVGQKCEGGKATVAHLKRITDIYEGAEYRPVPISSRSTLTIMTKDKSGGQHLYTFLVSTIDDRPAPYHTVNIVPDAQVAAAPLEPLTAPGDSQPVAQVLPKQNDAPDPELSGIRPVVGLTYDIQEDRGIDSERVSKGLELYRVDPQSLKGRGKPRDVSTEAIARVRQFLFLSRSGMAVRQAINLSKTDLSLLLALQKLAAGVEGGVQ
jgi:hypothetical protein